MSEHVARVVWEVGEAPHREGRYTRAHRWQFDGGLALPASASPERVRPPLSDPGAVDPEEAFVAAIASCHMLWFLDLAQRAGFALASYVDEPCGTMAADDRGRWAFRDVELRPSLVWLGEPPSAEQLAELHERAHEACFLASSVNFAVRVRA